MCVCRLDCESEKRKKTNERKRSECPLIDSHVEVIHLTMMSEFGEVQLGDFFSVVVVVISKYDRLEQKQKRKEGEISPDCLFGDHMKNLNLDYEAHE